MIVFGASLNVMNLNYETPRHLAATSTGNRKQQQQQPSLLSSSGSFSSLASLTSSSSSSSSPSDVILYMLDAVGAKRCINNKTKFSNTSSSCSEGCSPSFLYNGIPPANLLFLRNSQMYNEFLTGDIVRNIIQKKQMSFNDQNDLPISNNESNINKDNNNKKEQKIIKKLKLLSLDGGGVRGLILVQILDHLEKLANYQQQQLEKKRKRRRRILEMFDWIAGTSTGGILALLLASGYDIAECRQIYFLLKDELFTGPIRPYSSEKFESFLKKYLGEHRQMWHLQQLNKTK